MMKPWELGRIAHVISGQGGRIPFMVKPGGNLMLLIGGGPLWMIWLIESIQIGST